MVTFVSKDTRRQGTWLAALAFGLWGLLPLYWRTVGDVGTSVLLVERLFWAALFSVGLVAVRRDLPALVHLILRSPERGTLLVASALTGVNWGLYTWAMVDHRLVEAAQGYFLNPLVLALLGAVFRNERPGAVHYVALGLALVGLVVAAASAGAFPWLSLGLAGSFSLYALCKSKVKVDPMVGLAFETLVCLPVALAVFVFTGGQARALVPDVGQGAGWTLVGLLALSGPVTAVPLMIFSAAARKATFLRLGFIEYLSPTLTLVVGLALGAPFSPSDALVFGFIGLSCLVFVVGEGPLPLPPSFSAKFRRILTPGGATCRTPSMPNRVPRTKSRPRSSSSTPTSSSTGPTPFCRSGTAK